jgi:RNA polymerase subunit RPABC4/transcription elongation factor Spt4/septal ring factor EnvC (AmiA/AmiB activator)
VSDIIESIKQGADQVLSNIDQQGRLKSTLEGLKSQWTEVERRRHTNQLNNEIKNAQSEMKQLTTALGLQTLSLYDAGKIHRPELARLCERINELRAEIDERKAALAKLKKELSPALTECPQCRAEVASGADFCHKCGAQITAPAQPLPAAPAARAVVRLRCPKCKTIVPDGAGFCPTCGVKLKMPQAASGALQFCASCGAKMNATSRFCPVCGSAAESRS